MMMAVFSLLLPINNRYQHKVMIYLIILLVVLGFKSVHTQHPGVNYPRFGEDYNGLLQKKPSDFTFFAIVCR